MSISLTKSGSPGMPDDPDHIVEISPNASLSGRGAAWFYLSIVAGTLMVSGPMIAMGFWPILPFAGFELALLAFVLWSVQRGGRYREVIRIGRDKILVEKGEHRVRERLEFARHWSAVELRRPTTRSHASRLLITGQGRGCEVGRCLTDSERAGLATRLREFIGPVNATPELPQRG
jgi:uncharacterized membrane protein